MMIRLGLLVVWTAGVMLVVFVARWWVWHSFYRDLDANSIVRRLRAEELAGAMSAIGLMYWLIGMLVIGLALHVGR